MLLGKSFIGETMTNDEIISFLREIKERLFTYGWMKGDLGGSEGPNCFLGALYAVSGQEHVLTGRATFGDKIKAHNRMSPVIWAFEQVIPDQVTAQFNDAPGRTFDEVVDAIDLTIKSLEG